MYFCQTFVLPFVSVDHSFHSNSGCKRFKSRQGFSYPYYILKFESCIVQARRDFSGCLFGEKGIPALCFDFSYKYMGSDPEETAQLDLDNLTLIPGMWVKGRIQRLFFLVKYKVFYASYCRFQLKELTSSVQQGSSILCSYINSTQGCNIISKKNPKTS